MENKSQMTKSVNLKFFHFVLAFFILIFAFSIFYSAQADITTGLIGHWKFDEAKVYLVDKEGLTKKHIPSPAVFFSYGFSFKNVSAVDNG